LEKERPFWITFLHNYRKDSARKTPKITGLNSGIMAGSVWSDWIEPQVSRAGERIITSNSTVRRDGAARNTDADTRLLLLSNRRIYETLPDFMKWKPDVSKTRCVAFASVH
jgi:hypothetical protein